MIHLGLFFVLLLAFLDWFAVYNQYERINYISKPGTLFALIVWFICIGGLQGALLWFGVGLVFSLVGDVFLLLPERYFRAGLLVFLLAHIAYIIGFNQPLPALGVHFYILALAIAALGMVMFGIIRAGLQQHEEGGKMLVPVLVYSITISIMLFSALLTLFRADWQICASGLAAGGGALFFFSDYLLAYNRFVQPLPHARLWVRITYHLGQLGLAAGALYHFVICSSS